MSVFEIARMERWLGILPHGGHFMAVYKAYFDESGGFDTGEGIFCLSGYLFSSESAFRATELWKTALGDLPYFHMVDCANETPDGFGLGVFKDTPRHERIELVKELLSIIKEHSIWGFSAMMRRGRFFHQERTYVFLAKECLHVFRLKLGEMGMRDAEITYFFEAGHADQGRASQHIATEINLTGSSVEFCCKQKTPLLQSADLLAWQSVKYVKDLQSRKRPPRKDFMSLMQHRHSFAFIDFADGPNGDVRIMWAEWPEHLRPDVDEFWVFNAQYSGAVMGRFLPIWRQNSSYILDR